MWYDIKSIENKEYKMNYIILDMEWNQPLYSKMTVTEPITLHAEVVQIGAVKLDEDFARVDTFSALIAPKYYKKMHRRVQSLTRITTKLLEDGIPFLEAYERFMSWCGRDCIFLTWGPDDIPVLRDNLTIHSLGPELLPKWYNLQIIFDSQITKERRQVALGRALEAVGEVGEDAHNALNDAVNTAIVCTHLDMKKGIEEYAKASEEFFAPKNECKGAGKLYKNKREVMRDPEVLEAECPECKGKAVCSGVVKQNQYKSLAIAKCACGAEFLMKFKFIRLECGRIKVKRTIEPLTDENKAFYEAKKQIRKVKKQTNTSETLVLTE